jgi:hypothetical protein
MISINVTTKTTQSINDIFYRFGNAIKLANNL